MSHEVNEIVLDAKLTWWEHEKQRSSTAYSSFGYIIVPSARPGVLN
jgi:hypothetical protein